MDIRIQISQQVMMQPWVTIDINHASQEEMAAILPMAETCAVKLLEARRSLAARQQGTGAQVGEIGDESIHTHDHDSRSTQKHVR
jgi:hypothetical protein